MFVCWVGLSYYEQMPVPDEFNELFNLCASTLWHQLMHLPLLILFTLPALDCDASLSGRKPPKP